jgi:hypothetical protein
MELSHDTTKVRCSGGVLVPSSRNREDSPAWGIKGSEPGHELSRMLMGKKGEKASRTFYGRL